MSEWDDLEDVVDCMKANPAARISNSSLVLRNAAKRWRSKQGIRPPTANELKANARRASERRNVPISLAGSTK